MKQSKLVSLIETCTNVFLGFLISLVVQQAIVWYYQLPLIQSEIVFITFIFTFISILRGYAVRRWFEVYFHSFAKWLGGKLNGNT